MRAADIYLSTSDVFRETACSIQRLVPGPLVKSVGALHACMSPGLLFPLLLLSLPLFSGPALVLIYGHLQLMVQNQDLCLWSGDWTRRLIGSSCSVSALEMFLSSPSLLLSPSLPLFLSLSLSLYLSFTLSLPLSLFPSLSLCLSQFLSLSVS